MDMFRSMMNEANLEIKIAGNRRNQDETSVFLYNVENYFVVGANDITLDRDKLHAERIKFHVQQDEEFLMTTPHLAPTGEIQQIEKKMNCT